MSTKIPIIDCFNSSEGKTVFGVCNTIPSTAVARTIASTPNISWVIIDAEHGQINDSHFYAHATAVASTGRSPLIRVPHTNSWWIKRALDAGAHGIVCPLLHTPDEVKAAVAAARYPSAAEGGVRGFNPLFAPHTFGPNCTLSEYVEVAKKLIETRDALANLEEIAQVEGLDVLIIGPYDLALNLGFTLESIELEEHIAHILATAHKYGKKAAIYCSDGEAARQRAKQGFDMVCVGMDIMMLACAYVAESKIATREN